MVLPVGAEKEWGPVVRQRGAEIQMKRKKSEVNDPNQGNDQKPVGPPGIPRWGDCVIVHLRRVRERRTTKPSQSSTRLRRLCREAYPGMPALLTPESLTLI